MKDNTQAHKHTRGQVSKTLQDYAAADDVQGYVKTWRSLNHVTQ